MEDGAVVERDAVLLGVRDGIGPVFGALGQADEIGDSEGSYVGNRVQVSLPAVVSMMAVGRAGVAAPVWRCSSPAAGFSRARPSAGRGRGRGLGPSCGTRCRNQQTN